MQHICSTRNVIIKTSAPKINDLKTNTGNDFAYLFTRKTCPCTEYSLKPHFYVVKLRFAGVYLFFLFLLQNIDCGYTLEPPRRGGFNVCPQSEAVLTCTHNLRFEQK